ncbi:MULTISPECIES: transposase [Bacteroides]|uniref:transposase n=1 Tax=Bacteroides TaxID=816 RepID=UPI001404C26B|nr:MULTISPECIES: transposase [Bacteroides]MCM1780555.1 transposase [Bacteroides thetaiotaomicron]MCS2241950.1 transposase [Bacteroides thetaiotaomicron]MDC2160327.1 hypothetical protein [Bacteroides thetaiotaomicron]MDC7152129.1 hypothetical protein [Bacteroides faecis]UVP56637.1 transposase [Bacteroides thetaiotaomicron]
MRRTQHDKWNGLLTTDTGLDFLKAWQNYSQHWALEIVFKDCKTNLGFGKCQSTDFASQIAAATLCYLQYNISRCQTIQRLRNYQRSFPGYFQSDCLALHRTIDMEHTSGTDHGNSKSLQTFGRRNLQCRYQSV